MRWLSWHFRKPVPFVILYTVIFCLGIFAFPFLNFSLAGGEYSPVVSVKTQYFGMDSRSIERLITIPIENAVSGIRGVASLSSVSEDGQSIVMLRIDPKRPLRKATLEIKSAVDSVAQNFPTDVQEPVISHYDPSQTPVMILSFYPSDQSMGLTEVRRLVEKQVKPLLERVDGIAECLVTGGKQEEIVVRIDPGKLAATGLQMQDIQREIQDNNWSMASGFLRGQDSSVPVYSHGKLKGYLDLANILAVPEDTNLSSSPLSQLGTVDKHYKRVENISRVNGGERVSLYLQKKSGVNTLNVCSALRKYFQEAELTGIVRETDFDQSEEISKALSGLLVSIGIGLVLLFVITLLFIPDFRKCLLAMAPIPLSIVIVFIVAVIFNIEMDGMILSGLDLGAGLLVDSGLVVIEFLGKPARKDFYRHAMGHVKRLSPMIVASLLTVMCVFIPILLSNESVRYQYAGFAFSILLMMAVSFFLATGLVPLGYRALFAGKRPEREKKTRLVVLSERFYSWGLRRLMPHRRSVLILSVFVCLLGLAALLTRGNDLSSADYIREIYASVEPDSGTSLEDTDRICRDIETLLLGRKEIEKLILKVEHSHASMIIRLKKPMREVRAQKFVEKMKKELSSQDTFVYFSYGGGQDSSRELTLQIIGDDQKKLEEYCRQASRTLYSLPLFKQVVLRFKDDAPEYRVKPDLAKLQLSGISLQTLIDEARTHLYGVIASKLTPDDSGQIDIRLMAGGNSGAASLEDFLAIPVRASDGNLVRLGELVTVEKSTGVSKIYRLNKKKAVSLTATLTSGVSMSRATRQALSAVRALKLPDGYYVQADERTERMEQNSRDLLWAVIFAVYLTYAVLVLISESLSLPLLLLMAIPFAFPGIALGLWMFGFSMSMPVYVALILLVGIVINNNVLLLAGYRESNTPREFLKSAKEMLSSVLLTSFNSVVGMLPLIFFTGSGQEIWIPFSVTIIFGLTCSTILSLFVLPLIGSGLIEKRKGKSADLISNMERV